MPPTTRSGPPRPQPQAGKTVVKPTTGPAARVPCPWCQYRMDFRALAGADMGGVGEGNIGFETGAVMSCDNPRCRRKFKIAAIEQVVVVRLAPVNGPPAPPPRSK